jgi:hypothetical protein
MCTNITRFPTYPADMHPRRLISITYFKIVPKMSPVKGMEILPAFSTVSRRPTSIVCPQMCESRLA